MKNEYGIDLDQLKTLYMGGKTVKAIADLMGFKLHAVRTTLLASDYYGGRRHGLTSRHAANRAAHHEAVKKLSHLPVSAIAKTIGVSDCVVISCLNDLGIERLSAEEVNRRTARRISEAGKAARSQFLAEVVRLFNEGFPVNRIAKMIGKSRATVNACLTDAGIELPSVSDGNIRSAAMASSDERRQRAARAHEATRAIGNSNITRLGNSIINGDSKRYVGFGEIEMIAELSKRGIESVSQAPVEGYNVDILCGNLAVEIHNSKTNPFTVTQRVRRIVKLVSSGYSVCYIWLDPGVMVSEAAIKQLVAFHEFARSNPAPRGQYWVIRGNGEIYSRAGSDLEDLAAVFSAYSAL